MNRILFITMGTALAFVLLGKPASAHAQAQPANEVQAIPVNVGDMPSSIRQVYSYLITIDEYSRVARDPGAIGIAAVLSAGELLKPQGNEAAINFFSTTLQRTTNESVRRVIRLQLIELYKQSSQPDKALEELKSMILEAP